MIFMASITYQVVQCVKEIDMIGQSKKSARQKGIKGIHSYKTKEEVTKIGKQFARWVRERYNVKQLHQVTEEHYRAFMDSKAHTSLDYRRGIETHLRLLQEGLQRRSERFGKEISSFVPEKRLIASRGRLEGVRDRSYTESDLSAIRGVITPKTARAMDLMLNLGLRVNESVQLRVEHIQGDYIVIQNDTITKGGRDRVIPVPDGFKDDLMKMCEGKEPTERLVPISAATVQMEFKDGCKRAGVVCKGTHGLRHTYARNRVNELMNKDEKQLFSSCIERYAENKRFDYGEHNKDLYKTMVEKMDKVHGELGHGKGRFDLAVRYMR